MDRKNLKGSICLLLASLIWGCAFAAQSASTEFVEPFTFNAVRSFLGSLVLLPIIFISDGIKKKNGTFVKYERKNLLIGGAVCGTVLFISCNLQQIGIDMGASSGKAGFITALYILLVPVTGIFMKRRVRPILWACIGVALCGLYLLCMNEELRVQKSDIFLILCALSFTFHIIFVDRFSQITDCIKLSCVQFLVCGVLSAVFMVFKEKPDVSSILDAWLPILYMGIMSSGCAYTLQIVGQKNTEPTLASMLMSLESVFSVLAGIVVLSQMPTAKEWLGCGLMFAAIIAAQIPGRKHDAERV